MPMGPARKRTPQVRVKGRRPARTTENADKRTKAQAALARRPRTAADY